MNLLDVFRRAEASGEQKQAVNHCSSKKVSFLHAGFEVVAK
jgi:hypothetical protein